MTDPIPRVTPPIPPKWPPPRLEKIVLEAVEVAEKKPPKTQSARRNFLRGVLADAAERLIVEAEGVAGVAGLDKKRWVRDQLLKVAGSFVKQLPDFLEPAAFKVLEAALDGIIETVFAELVTRGVVRR